MSRLKLLRGDLGVRLLALYLLFLGPVAIAALSFDQLASQRLEQDVKAADLALARAIALETNTFMENALQAVNQLATYPAVIEADPDGMNELFKTFMSVRPDVNLIYRLDPEGVMLFHYPTGPESTVGWDFSFRDYYQRALVSHNPLVSKGRISPTTVQPVATAVMPIWDENGNFNGLVATNIKLQFLSHTLARITEEHTPDQQFQIYIVDAAGQVIANPNPENLLSDAYTLFPAVTNAVLGGQSGNQVQEGAEGVDALFSFVPVYSSGWGVIVGRPTAAAFATPRAIHFGALAALAIFLVFGLLFWFALSRQVIDPLEQLSSFSQSISQNAAIPGEQRVRLANLSQRPDQVGNLTNSLQEMERAIETRIAELSTLLQTSASVVSTLDPQTVLDRILEQVGRLMKVKMCAIVALDEAQGEFRAQASRGLSRRYVENLAIDPQEPRSVALRAIRSGRVIQVSDTEHDPTFTLSRPRARVEGYRSLVAVPLNTQHAPPSALLVYHPEPHIFSEREIELLTTFANHAAMAIENAALFARSDMQLQEQTRRLEALIQSLQNGLILEDLKGRVLYANRRIAELAAVDQEAIQGTPVPDLLARILERSPDQDLAEAAIETALNGQDGRIAEILLEEQGQARDLRLQIFGVTDRRGMHLGRGWIFQDITQLRELDRMKTSLISTVSHELRTPLAAIKGYVTTLLAEDVHWDIQSQHEFLEIISREADRLSNMVNNLLDMSRIEAGNLVVSKERCDLRELVIRAAEQVLPAPGPAFEVRIPANLPPIPADPERIELVLRNLIENAVKYAGENSPISVRADIEGSQVVVRVEDEGPGIPQEHRERIFDRFYRAESGIRQNVTGAGLGLAISRGFVRAHGGEIWLEPRSRGTCFAFSLPLEAQEIGGQVPIAEGGDPR